MINYLDFDKKTVFGNISITREDNTVLNNVNFTLSDIEKNLQKIAYTYSGSIYHAVQGNYIGGAIQAGGVLNLVGLTNLTHNGIKSVSFQLLRNDAGPTSPELVSYVRPIVEKNCDTDGDYVPNYLDMDSDNDGCSDAIEGGDNLFINSVVSSVGSLVQGNGINPAVSGLTGYNLPVQKNLGVNVNITTGVPNVVSSAGQSVGTSTNAAVQDTNCTDTFICDSSMYISQSPNNSIPTTLYYVNTINNPLTFVSVGNNSHGYVYNAMGYNPIDNYLYALEATTPNLIRINKFGVATSLGAITNLPSGVSYNTGEIDHQGNFYVKASGTNATIYKISITNKIVTQVINLSQSVSISDFAYNIVDGLLYGVTFGTVNNPSHLVSMDPSNGNTYVFPTNMQISGNWGAVFASSLGSIYASVNGGQQFAQFDLSGGIGKETNISVTQPASTNDGAHCVNGVISFNTDLQVTKTDNKTTYTPGDTNTYTVVVTNNGPFGVVNAIFTDPLPTNIPNANVTYTASPSAGCTTSVVGTQTGAINDLVSLTFGGSITYTVKIEIPTTVTGNFTNIANISPPVNGASFDTFTINNTASDTDEQVGNCFYPPKKTGTPLETKHGITSLGRAGTDNSNWPMVRRGAWTALESKTKGFVVNRLTDAQIAAIPTADLVVGMMVYNITQDCLMINVDASVAGWKCVRKQDCF